MSFAGVWPSGKMTAVEIVGPQKVALREIAIPAPAADAVLLRPTYVGLCGTDVELLHGTAAYLNDGRASFPLVFGHEWSGEVVAVGDAVENLAPGDRVVGQTMVACGSCRTCHRGQRQLCLRMTEVGLYGQQGAAAEYIRMPQRSLTRLPAAIADVDAAFIEPAVTVVGAFEKVACSVGDDVAVVGTGTIGLLAVQLAARVARSVHAIGIDEAGLKLAARCGAQATLRPQDAEPGRYSLVIEASGAAAGFGRSLEIAQAGGRVAVIGVANEPQPMVAGNLVLRGIDVFGIRHGLNHYDATIDLIAAGVLDPGPLVAEVFAPERAAAAFERLEHGRSGPPKVLLGFNRARGQT